LYPWIIYNTTTFDLNTVKIKWVFLKKKLLQKKGVANAELTLIHFDSPLNLEGTARSPTLYFSF
jgi:hypothetical protein